MSGTLFGVGLGPGDPELITLKAIHTLQSVDTIFAPASREGHSLAGDLVRTHLPQARIELLEFPMTENPIRLEQAWDAAAELIRTRLVSVNAAFVTIGDPLLYGSYTYIYQRLCNDPQIRIQTIPGITGMNAAAAVANFTLTEQNERLLLLTGAVNPQEFRQFCATVDTLVIYKPKANGMELIQTFFAVSPDGQGVMVENCGMAGEQLTYLNRDFQPQPVGYFTVIILRKPQRRA